MDNAVALAAVLTRFGCCELPHAVALGHTLVGHGHAQTRHGHRLRHVAFGSLPPDNPSRGINVLRLGAIVEYLSAYARQHWPQLQSSESKDPGLSFLMTPEKAERGRRARAAFTRSTSLKGNHS